MTARLKLQIQDGAGDFEFDVDGEFVPSIEPIYKEAADPPQLAELRHTWEFRRCYLHAAGDSREALWDRWLAFVALFEDRDAHPSYVRLLRDESVVEWQLDDTTYEQLRFELIEVSPDDLVPDAPWNAAIPVTLRVSGVRKFADANGIVDFSQRVIVSYDAGLQTIEWQTRIVTASGTSALTKAQSFARIDITTLGSGFAYVTNGPDGIDYELIDADEGALRTPTIVEATSRVREFGVAIGASGPAVAPDEVDLTITTTTTAEQTETVTEAFARGPNAQQWVTARKPAGRLADEEVTDRPALREYRGRWVRRVARAQAVAEAARAVRVTVQGGKPAIRARPIPGHLPRLQRGALVPWEASVEIEVRRTGGEGKLSELPLPSLIGEPWVLDPARSTEGAPQIEERGADPTQHRWLRVASLTFVSVSEPSDDVAAHFRGSDPVDTYLLGS